MLKSDFKKHGIEPFFTPVEVVRTGASVLDVQLRAMLTLLRFRKKIKRRVRFLKNGITTGKHSSPGHPDGLIFDVTLLKADGPIHVQGIVFCAIEAGFKTIGVYHNGVKYSFHLGIDSKILKGWTGYKKRARAPWVKPYSGLINDPAFHFLSEFPKQTLKN